MTRTRRAWLLPSAIVVLILLSAVAWENIPHTELRNLKAAYTAELRRHGDPDARDFVRAPVTEPVLPGDASEHYAEAQGRYVEAFGVPGESALVERHAEFAFAAMEWAFGSDGGEGAERFREFRDRARPAVDAIVRGACTSARGPFRDLRPVVTTSYSCPRVWTNDLILLGMGDAAALVGRGQPSAAVTRALSILRFQEDLRHAGVAPWGGRAFRLFSTMVTLGKLPRKELDRVIDFLRGELARWPDLRSEIRVASLRVQRPLRVLADGDLSLLGLPARTAAQPDLSGVVDAALEAGPLRWEIASAWRGIRTDYRELERLARFDREKAIAAALERFWGMACCPDNRVRDMLLFREISAERWHLNALLHERFDREELLLELLLRRELSTTGEFPRSIDEVRPKEVRRFALGGVWFLKPYPDGHSVSLGWSGDDHCEHKITR